MRPARTLRGLSAALFLAGFAAAAMSRPALYKCGEELQLKVDFTPRKAQLHLNDKQTTLVRLKSAHHAHYANRKAGIKLVARKGDLTLHEGGRTHECKLQVTP
jgi:membrane-bound inhibitor of C-type lysozyme